ncbi:MAG: A/G-specific adenine glycosylase [Bryobacteraceae bacterium]|nr:A/G-specific adenine glycosylase [Bryobacteraceae bacterium]
MQNPRQAARLLLEWYARMRRDLPWRRTRDPWRILVSEVMLQQTRVAAVIPYYERFLARFPTPESLAAAPEEELLALWAGLGYYSRARHLRRAAEAIAARGAMPRTAEEWRTLPGVGDYTAAAVASICFHEPCAVLDGNVVRVMARLSAEAGDVSSAPVRLRLKELAQRMLDPRRPGDFNQALMELGATICLPRQPKCLLCPLAAHCRARAAGIEEQLPVRARRREAVKLELDLAVVLHRGRILLRKRSENDGRLAGFWELPEVGTLPDSFPRQFLGSFRHSITRHDYAVRVWRIQTGRVLPGFEWQALPALAMLPLSSMTRKALELAGILVASAATDPDRLPTLRPAQPG